MEERTIIMISLVLVFCLAFVLSGVTMITSNVIGVNITNDTAIAKVYVWNTEPTLYKVTVSPASVDLTPGNQTIVNCTGYVWDYNSWSDILFVNSTFYRSGTNEDAEDDNNNHYTNTSATCVQVGGSDTNATCSALFNVWYYANDGTWTCNMTIQDQGGNATEREINFTSSNNATTSINTVLGINVPDEIDYGNLSVTETSENISVNITNYGNVAINVSVRGWGGTDVIPANNLSMICQLGNITQGSQRYSSVTTTTYANMTNLTNSTAGIPNFDLPARTNDTQYDNDRNQTYWRIQIPLSVGGFCNGTVEFSATDTS